VSAQGGEYKEEEKKVLAKKPFNERPLLAGEKPANISNHDITYPVRWLLE
jgi:hypothetical protein